MARGRVGADGVERGGRTGGPAGANPAAVATTLGGAARAAGGTTVTRWRAEADASALDRHEVRNALLAGAGDRPDEIAGGDVGPGPPEGEGRGLGATLRSLPLTGGQTGRLAALAGGLVGAGVAALSWQRRRREAPDGPAARRSRP